MFGANEPLSSSCGRCIAANFEASWGSSKYLPHTGDRSLPVEFVLTIEGSNRLSNKKQMQTIAIDVFFISSVILVSAGTSVIFISGILTAKRAV